MGRRGYDMWPRSELSYELLCVCVCVSLFTHTGAINSRHYQHCGHSKTEKYIINTEGRLFSQTPKVKGWMGGGGGSLTGWGGGVVGHFSSACHSVRFG